MVKDRNPIWIPTPEELQEATVPKDSATSPTRRVRRGGNMRIASGDVVQRGAGDRPEKA